MALITQQLSRACSCGGKLIRSHGACPARQRLYKFKYGTHFIHSGTHNHPRPTHLLHLQAPEEAAFTQLVIENPKAGPLELSIGPQTLHGPQRPASEISSILLNKDRIKYEQRKIKQASRGVHGGDHFLSEFAQFCEDHPGFILQSVIGTVSVISAQTSALRAELIKAAPLTGLDGNLNGIVSDAAHGFWRDRSALLIISSTFSPRLRCWVPGIFSYANGSSAEHYRLHFLALFQSMAREAYLRKISIDDTLFANVVDFSEAERVGFIEAFVSFWREEGTTRTADDLRGRAKTLLKGCQQHFRAGVTRIKRLGGVIPLGHASRFEKMAHGLLHLADLNEFRSMGQDILASYPEVAPWLEWWLRESHAPLLFGPYRQMDRELWNSLPDTTNAEEAMHWKIYAGIGKDQTLMSGLVSLYAFAGHYERLLTGATVGTLIRYGQPEPWKETFQLIGRTKPTRDPVRVKHRRYRNDGRPPDTNKAMLQGKKRQKTLQQKLAMKLKGASTSIGKTTTISSRLALSPLTGASVEPGLATTSILSGTLRKTEASPAIVTLPKVPLRTLPCYSQSDNSCWLDVSLQVLFVAVLNDYHSFQERFEGHVASDALLFEVYRVFDLRRSVQSEPRGQNNNPQYLNLQRDGLRRQLFQQPRPIITSLNSMENIVAWLGEVLRSGMAEPANHFALTYFMGHVIDLRKCSASERQHVQVSAQPRPVFYHSLDATLNAHHDGSLASWLKTLIMKPPSHAIQCWRKAPSSPAATNTAPSDNCVHAASVTSIYVSLPVLLIVDVNPEGGQDWNCPERIVVAQKTSSGPAIIYQLVARQATIYEYDSMRHEGFAQELPGAKVNTHLAGVDSGIAPPETFTTSVVLYQLQGGTATQEQFLQTQQSHLSKVHHIQLSDVAVATVHTASISLSNQALVKRPSAEHFWLSEKRRMANKTIDYDAIATSARAPKQPAGHGSLSGRNIKDFFVSSKPIMAGAVPSATVQLPPGPPPRNVVSNAPVSTSHKDDSRSLDPGGTSQDSDSGSERSPLLANLPTPVATRQLSPFPVQCRCGASGDGNTPSILDGLDAINRLSSLAGNDSNLKQRRSKRLLPQNKHLVLWRLSECLTTPPTHSDLISEEDICDELWSNSSARRQIRLGRWRLASTLPASEPDLADLVPCPFTQEIDSVLRPHAEMLEKLLHWRSLVSRAPGNQGMSASQESLEADIPVLAFLRQVASKSALPAEREGLVVHTGDLSIKERSQIIDWIDSHITEAKANRHLWLSGPLMAHAITLVLAARKGSDLLQEAELPPISDSEDPNSETQRRRRLVLQHSWEYQVNAIEMRPMAVVDVDRECIQEFERRLFERSKASGEAGFYQWGKDVGSLQGNWSPYDLGPSTWAVGDFIVEDEDIWKEGPNYLDDQADSTSALAADSKALSSSKPAKGRGPKPRPRPRRGKSADTLRRVASSRAENKALRVDSHIEIKKKGT
ncbi:hypothetical protein ACG7TL_000074 [Trametes sanguinea]